VENFDAKENISHPGFTYTEEMLAYVADDRKKALKVMNSSVRHYADCYGYIPLWVLTNTFSFGTMTSFYRCMRRSEREHVAMRFSLPESVLTRFLVALNFYRNCCAHGGRFYEYKIVHYTIPSTSLTARLGLQGSAGRPFIQGQGDILALFIMLRHLLEQRPFCDFADEVDSELTELGSSLSTICIDDVTAVMGLSENWRLLRDS
jgi:abortive infection bacteriophage resistance protein